MCEWLSRYFQLAAFLGKVVLSKEDVEGVLQLFFDLASGSPSSHVNSPLPSFPAPFPQISNRLLFQRLIGPFSTSSQILQWASSYLIILGFLPQQFLVFSEASVPRQPRPAFLG